MLALAAPCLILYGLSVPAGAQVTSGNATTGGTLYNANCDGCHGATVGSSFPAIKNAANAGGLINEVMIAGMGGYTAGSFTSTQENDIAAYIAQQVSQTSPTGVAVPHNTGGTVINMQNIRANTTYGPITKGIFSSGGSRGSATFSTSGTTIQATYVPDAGQCGTDTVSYYGATAANAQKTNIRSFGVDIADPAAPNITTSLSTRNGTYNSFMSFSPTSTGGTVASYILFSGSLPAGLTLNGTSGTISGTPTQVGSFPITLRGRNCLNGNLSGQVSDRAITITIAKANQAALTALINASSANAVFVYQSPNGTATLSTSGGSGVGAVSYMSSNTAVCNVSGTTLTLVGGGVCTITATKAADTNYNLATDTIGVTVNPASQTIAFNAQVPASQNYVQGGTFAVSPTGTATSGLALTYDSNTPSVCTLPGTTSTTVTIVAAGTCTIGANQAGNTNYNAATEVPRNVTINAVLPQPPAIGVGVGGNAQAVINFTPPTNTGGTNIIDYTATCSATGQTTRTATVSLSPATVLMMTNGQTYTCSVTARNSVGSSAASGTVMVVPTSSPVITSLNNTTFTIASNGSFNITATGAPAPAITSSGVLPSGVLFTQGAPGSGTATLSGTPAAGTAGSYPLTLTATNGGGSVMQSFTLTVQKANQIITFAALPNIPMRPVTTALTATASSGLTVTLSIAPATVGSCFLLGNTLYTTNIGTCTVLANQAGNTSYNSAPQVQRSFTISQGTQELIWGAQPGAVYSPGGSAGFGSKASSVDPIDLSTATGLDPSYSVTTPAICAYTLNAVSILAAGTCTIQVDQPGDANYAAATPITQDIVISMAPQTISWGAQSNQAFGSGGTFAISPLATGGGSGIALVYNSTTPTICSVSGSTVTKLRAGLCTLAANQAGDGNYSAAVQVTRSLTITASVPGAPIATLATPSDSQIVIDFDVPASDGGSSITGYTAACGPGGIVANGAGSPIKVTGLTNGVSYSCTVRAQNAAGNSALSNILMATPFLETGANTWTNVCSGCHGALPVGVRFNAAGTTGAVINYVRSVQPMMLASNAVQALTLNEMAEVAKYIATFVPAISLNTAFNTPVNVDVASHLTLGTVSFDLAEVVTPPQHGTLGAFSGTIVTYTPTPGYVGVDTFTYRGNHNAPGVPGDPRTVTITIAPPPPPVITSSTTANGVFNTTINYQITATNTPTSYGATGLGPNCAINTMSGLITCTPMATGAFMVTVSATNAGGTGMQVVTVTVSAANQSITFGAAVPSSRQYSPGGTFAVNPLAVASSGLPVSYGSLTTGVCTVSGTTVTMLRAGICSISADQAGNANYNAALEVAHGVTITPGVPGAPTGVNASPGVMSAAISFSPPTNDGGSAITSYTATCSPSGMANNAVSPIALTGLTNGQTYTCTVTASNGSFSSPASAAVMVTPTAAPVAPAITSGNAANFNVLTLSSFNVNATGTPAPTLSIMGTLPMGVSFNPMTGTLSGTPASGTANTYPLTFTAANGTLPDATQNFTLTVAKLNQTITFNNPGTQNYTTTPIPLTASSTSGLTVALVSTTPSVCTVSGITLTLVTVGTCSITASQAGNSDYNAATSVNRAFSVNAASQTITFPAQSPASRGFLAGSSFAISPVATASSGLTVIYSSMTTGVCTLVGVTVTMVAPGTCTIAADQAGNANYSAAPQVTRAISLNATVPGAPTIGAATGGNSQATVNFTPPANNGGSAITGYTATCNPGAIAGTGMASPIVVSGLTNNVAYTCSVTATNGVGTGAASATVSVTPLSGQGSTLWTQVCDVCHTAVPSGNQLNGAGTTATALNYVRSNQTLMAANAAVQALSNADLADIATYIAANIEPNQVTTTVSLPVLVDVHNHITLTSQVWSAFTAIEVVTAPAHGSLGAFGGTGGTQIQYTPTPGYIGADSFTYRGKRTGGIAYNGDAQTVTIMVNPAPPAIISSLSATGTFGQLFSYQITATNTPTTFDATGLPAGLSVNAAGLISGTPAATGSFSVALMVGNAGGSGGATLALQIDPAPQVISFPAQSTPSRPYAAGGSFAIAPLATGGGSGNPILYGSATPSVCTVSGSTVSIVAAGTCSITADQAGSTNYAEAPQATRGVTITAVAPGAPGIGTATPGNMQATIAFTAPANNGGSPITGYTATCGSASAAGAGSPLVVMGLNNGMQYACSVTATNSAGTGSASATVNVTPTAITVPGAPVIGTAAAGNTSASVAFTPPASDGGSAITGYAATCNPGNISANGAMSPINVTGLSNGVAYTCTVRATNIAGTGAASAGVNVTPQSSLTLSNVFSRKTHGALGDFDVEIDRLAPVGGAVTVEPRQMGSGHRVVFRFSGAPGTPGSVSVQDASGMPYGGIGISGPVLVGNEVIVTLTGLAETTRLKVLLTGVDGSLNVSASVGFLIGDVSNSRAVTAADISAVKTRSGLTTDVGNARFDINLNGAINNSDVSAVKARSGMVLP